MMLFWVLGVVRGVLGIVRVVLGVVRVVLGVVRLVQGVVWGGVRVVLDVSALF